jgi:hypothetical protein
MLASLGIQKLMDMVELELAEAHLFTNHIVNHLGAAAAWRALRILSEPGSSVSTAGYMEHWARRARPG